MFIIPFFIEIYWTILPLKMDCKKFNVGYMDHNDVLNRLLEYSCSDFKELWVTLLDRTLPKTFLSFALNSTNRIRIWGKWKKHFNWRLLNLLQIFIASLLFYCIVIREMKFLNLLQSIVGRLWNLSFLFNW